MSTHNNKPITISTLRKLKKASEKFSCLTAYEATLAQKISDNCGNLISEHL